MNIFSSHLHFFKCYIYHLFKCYIYHLLYNCMIWGPFIFSVTLHLSPWCFSWEYYPHLFNEFCNMGFPDILVKNPPAMQETPVQILGSGRSPGKQIGCQLQCSWASLVAELVKNPPALRETWVWSLGWEDPLERRKATHSSILAWRIPWTVHGWKRKESDMTKQLSLSHVM